MGFLARIAQLARIAKELDPDGVEFVQIPSESRGERTLIGRFGRVQMQLQQDTPTGTWVWILVSSKDGYPLDVSPFYADLPSCEEAARDRLATWAEAEVSSSADAAGEEASERGAFPAALAAGWSPGGAG